MDLGFYFRGHGLTVADRNHQENGDYKEVAFIRPSGIINFKADPEQIPAEDLQKIQAQADRAKAEFMEAWEKMPLMKQYEVILDSLTPSELVAMERGTPAQETINKYFNRYLERA